MYPSERGANSRDSDKKLPLRKLSAASRTFRAECENNPARFQGGWKVNKNSAEGEGFFVDCPSYRTLQAVHSGIPSQPRLSHTAWTRFHTASLMLFCQTPPSTLAKSGSFRASASTRLMKVFAVLREQILNRSCREHLLNGL
jgi:hypothetical protein